LKHVPVLVKEVLEYLDPRPNENFIDGTVGEGGHALEILKKTSPSGKILGVDWDEKQIESSRQNLSGFADRLVLVNSSYANIKEVAEKNNFLQVNGILLDLGFSSRQLDEQGRGFSFQKDEPLDMRYSNNNDLTAEIIVNEWPEQEVEKMLKEFGEEKFSRQIAKKIADQRKIKKIKSTFELKNIVENSIPGKFQHSKINPSTRTFQALRITVNRELDNLKEFLPKSVEVLSFGGRLAVISFHSLEDRIVKKFFKEQENLKILTKKPVEASGEEKFKNPRARSAKLRAVIKTSE